MAMKHFKIFSLVLLVGFLAAGWGQSIHAYSKKDSSSPTQAGVRSTMMLKKYMGQFGTLVAGMEIMRIKEKKADWEAIQITLNEMTQTLDAMKKADKDGNYKEFTEALEKNLNEVKVYGKKKDIKVYEAFDDLTNTCFKCHAAHRPTDFLIPKKDTPRISGSVSRLFQGN